MNNIINRYIAKLRSPKILIIGGIIGILLIFFSSFFTENDSSKASKNTDNSIVIEEYRKQLEEDISNMVTDITGSKKVTVVVTLESGIRYSYADTKEETATNKTDSKTKSYDTELRQGYITIKTDDGGEKALLITEQMPEVRGVAIVCEGGDSEFINEKIENAVTAAFNITSKRVYICGRKQ